MDGFFLAVLQQGSPAAITTGLEKHREPKERRRRDTQKPSETTAPEMASLVKGSEEDEKATGTPTVLTMEQIEDVMSAPSAVPSIPPPDIDVAFLDDGV